MARRIQLTGKLAAHFSSDDISASEVKASYDAAERVLSNPARFPNADVRTLEWLAEALFELSPMAAMEGL